MDARRRRPQPRQLQLPQSPPQWRLDEHTRQIGLRGVAEARAAVLRVRQQSAA